MLAGMPWLVLKLPAQASQAPWVAGALEACGALSVTIESAGGEERLQQGNEEVPLWDENQVSGLFPENTAVEPVLEAVRRALGTADPPAWQAAQLEDTDWVRAWMADYWPLEVVPGLWVVPSWCEPPDPRAVNVVLDPGLAFGAGTHPSTALCLAWLAAQPPAGCTVIDYGCGSGILAIAALKLGAARATGVDIDPQAIMASRANAERNGVAAQYDSVAPQALGAGTAEVVVANILARTLVELAPELTRRLRPGGRIALSGVLDEQAEPVRNAYAADFALETRERDGWVLLAGRKLT